MILRIFFGFFFPCTLIFRKLFRPLDFRLVKMSIQNEKPIISRCFEPFIDSKRLFQRRNCFLVYLNDMQSRLVPAHGNLGHTAQKYITLQRELLLFCFVTCSAHLRNMNKLQLSRLPFWHCKCYSDFSLVKPNQVANGTKKIW